MKDKIFLKVLYKLAYFLVFLFLLIILTFIFFPYGRLKKPLELSFYDYTGLKASIKSISPSVFFGLNLTGIKIYRPSSIGGKNKNDIAYIKNIYIKDIIATGADYLLFKDIPVNLNFEGIKINSVKKGFINIPALNLKSLKTDFYIKNVSISGRLLFFGDVSGSLNIKSAQIKPVFKINSGVFKVKPDKSLYGKFSTLFATIFKKGKDGYFIYDINNLLL
ncbi:MAG: hypothetical protein M0034_06325 [Deltaproteobacteria bacterium]|nr:hypothetical protein [Deltaproteobacteria bacterium]